MEANESVNDFVGYPSVAPEPAKVLEQLEQDKTRDDQNKLLSNVVIDGDGSSARSGVQATGSDSAAGRVAAGPRDVFVGFDAYERQAITDPQKIVPRAIADAEKAIDKRRAAMTPDDREYVDGEVDLHYRRYVRLRCYPTDLDEVIMWASTCFGWTDI